MQNSKAVPLFAGLIAMGLVSQPWDGHAQVGGLPPLVAPPTLEPLAPQQTLPPPARQPKLPPLQPPQKFAPLLAQADTPPAAAPGPPPQIAPGSAPADDANRLDTPAQTVKKAGEVIEDLTKGDIKALRRGPLLLHGNFCGIGGRPGLAPVDALDAACERHDNCTKTGHLPSCACDERLQREATAVVEDAASTPALKALATAVAASMAVLICE